MPGLAPSGFSVFPTVQTIALDEVGTGHTWQRSGVTRFGSAFWETAVGFCRGFTDAS